MSKYLQAEVGSFTEQVQVSADFISEIVKSLVAGNKHFTHLQDVGREVTGEVITEADPTAVLFTTVINETITLSDIAGLADLTLTLPTVIYHGLSFSSPATDSKPVQFGVRFTATVPASMQA